jgi:hypothetical protein
VLVVALMLVAAAQAEPVRPAQPAPEQAWRFVVPPPGDAFEHPPLRAIGLAREKPDDVRELAPYRGTSRRYGQLRYGSPGSVRVTVVLDETAPGEADLYVDADRNRRIEARDLVQGEGRLWRLPLDVANVVGEITTYARRTVVFRLGASGRTLSEAAAGYLEGKVRLAGRDHATRRTDGDGNGSYTDPQDRLWIDLDDDGRWDPVAEQFLFSAVLPIGGERFAVRSDPQATRLALEPIAGTGALRLSFRRPELNGRVANVQALLVGRDGSTVSLASLDADAPAPVGQYRVSVVVVTLTDPHGGLPWSFVFSDTFGNDKPPVWHTIEKDEVLAIDPIGDPVLKVEFAELLTTPKRGERVTILPRLYNAEGLLINSAFRGSPTATSSDKATLARVALCTNGGETLDVTSSGFL